MNKHIFYYFVFEMFLVLSEGTRGRFYIKVFLLPISQTYLQNDKTPFLSSPGAVVYWWLFI